MPLRKSLSKKLRFDVFKRDYFACQYCGASPPSVVLEVDHMAPVSKGGKNDPDNLITSCFDCNRGKAANSLSNIPQSLSDKAAILKEKREQLQGYEDVLNAEKKAKNKDVNKVVRAIKEDFPGYRADSRVKDSIRLFLDHFVSDDLVTFIRIAASKMHTPDQCFKYFCGMCWKRIKERPSYE